MARVVAISCLFAFLVGPLAMGGSPATVRAAGQDVTGPTDKPGAGPQAPIVEARPSSPGGVLRNAGVPSAGTNPRLLRQSALAQIVGQGKRPPAVTPPPTSLPAHGTIVSPSPVSGASLNGHAALWNGSRFVVNPRAPAGPPSTAHNSALVIPPATARVGSPGQSPTAFYGSSQVDSYNDACSPSAYGANETTVVQSKSNPNLVVVGANMYANADNSCSDSHAFAYYSHDGGQHWQQVMLPNQLYPNSGDPGVVFDPVRDVFVFSHVEYDQSVATNGRVAVDVSSDGANWSLDTSIAFGNFPNCNTLEGVCVDKPMIAVDQNPASPHYGRVAVTWSEFHNNLGNGGDLVVLNAYSDNGGVSWTYGNQSVNFTTNDCGNGSTPAFDANGDLMVAWEVKPSLCGQVGNTALFEELSPDGGATWPAPVDTMVSSINDIGFGGACALNAGGSLFRCNSFPSLAGDPNSGDQGGTAFVVVWANLDSGITDTRFPGQSATISEIHGISTTDGGGTWNAGAFAYDFMNFPNFGDKFFPWVAFAPNGRLDVGYSDREDNASAGNPNGLSYDEYGTEASSLASLRADSYIAYGVDQTLGNPGSTLFIGDYAGISSQDNNFDTFPVWTDVRDAGIPHVRTEDLCFINCYTFLAPYTSLFRGGTSFTDLYQFNTDPSFGGSGGGYWNAVGIREGSDGTVVDDDTYLYVDRYFSVVGATSDLSPPINDYTLENDNSFHGPSGPYFPQVHSYSSFGGTYTVQWAAGHLTISVGNLADSMVASDVIRIYDTFLSTGTTYYVGLRPAGGNTSNYSLTLHSASKGNQQGRANAVSDSGPVSPGLSAFAQYATGVDTSQWNGIVVVNNNGGAGSYTLYEDTATPSGTISIDGGATYTNNPSVSLTLTASNPTVSDPVLDMRFSTDGINFGSWLPFASPSPFTLAGPDGAKTVYVQFRNGAGVVSATASKSITLDTVPPVTTSNLTNSNGCSTTYFSPVKVTLSATDATSGVASTVYQIDGGAVTTYAGPFKVTSLAAHSVTFHSTDNAGNVEVAQTTSFTIVAPTLSLSATSGFVGTHLTASGGNYLSGETVNVYWDSTLNPVLGTGPATGCAFTAPITIPAAKLGAHTVIAVGQTSHVTAKKTFSVMPALAISPTQGKAGSNATMSGSGFGASEVVTIKWDCASATCTSTKVLGSPATDANGSFSGLAVVIPSPATTGNHTIGGHGGTSHTFAKASFKITLVISAVDGTTVDSSTAVVSPDGTPTDSTTPTVDASNDPAAIALASLDGTTLTVPSDTTPTP